MRALLTPLHARHTGIFLRPRPFGRENAADVEEPTAIGACSAPRAAREPDPWATGVSRPKLRMMRQAMAICANVRRPLLLSPLPRALPFRQTLRAMRPEGERRRTTGRRPRATAG